MARQLMIQHLSVNPGNYLDRHLIDCAKWIEDRSDVELVAIGIGHDVTRSYAHALTIVDVEQLGNVLIEKIEELLKVK
jgi:cobaltochelatase CobT